MNQNMKAIAGYSLSLVFCALATGGAVTLYGQEKSYREGLKEGQKNTAEKIRQAEFSARFSEGADYSHLCWTLRQLVDEQAKQSTRDKLVVIRTNRGTMEKCKIPLQNPNVRIKLEF